jgi:hypothetical protein
VEAGAGQRGDLVAPRICEFWKSVRQDDDWRPGFTGLNEAQLHAVRIN